MYVEMFKQMPGEDEPRWIHVQKGFFLDSPEQSPWDMDTSYDEMYEEDLPLEQAEEPTLHTLGRQWYPGRDYREFQMLAGVRGETFPPMKQPTLSLPEDVCDEIRVAYEGWGWDAHTLTWYTINEIEEQMTNGYFDVDDREQNAPYIVNHLIPELRSLKMKFWWMPPHPCEDIRVIFWFDN